MQQKRHTHRERKREKKVEGVEGDAHLNSPKEKKTRCTARPFNRISRVYETRKMLRGNCTIETLARSPCVAAKSHFVRKLGSHNIKPQQVVSVFLCNLGSTHSHSKHTAYPYYDARRGPRCVYLKSIKAQKPRRRRDRSMDDGPWCSCIIMAFTLFAMRFPSSCAAR